MARYIADIEANGLVDTITKVHCLVLIDADTGDVHDFADQDGYRPIAEGLRMLEEAEEIIGHNWLGYDHPALCKVYPEYSPKGRMTDTLILTRLLFGNIRETDFSVREHQLKRGIEPQLPGNLIGSHSLKAWGIRIGNHKDSFGDTADWSVWTPEMSEYCVTDVKVNAELYHKLADKFDIEGEWAKAIDIEHRFADLCLKQERHGFRFDVAAAEKLEAALRVRKAELEASLYDLFDPWWVGVGRQKHKRSMTKWVQSPTGADTRVVKVPTGETYEHTYKTGRTVTRQVKVEETQRGFNETQEEGAEFTKVELRVFNPGSRKHIADRLQKLYGWQPEDFTAGGDPRIDDEILSQLPYPPAKVLAEYFMVDKRLAQLADGNQAWLKQQRGGRIHGRINTLGAVTGRCTHSHPNVAQVPSIANAKGKVPYGAECRSLFLPDEGHVLLGCDAAGLELRCLAHFIRDGGRYAKFVLSGKKEEGTDIHTMNQKAAGLPTRSNAKTFI